MSLFINPYLLCVFNFCLRFCFSYFLAANNLRRRFHCTRVFVLNNSLFLLFGLYQLCDCGTRAQCIIISGFFSHTTRVLRDVSRQSTHEYLWIHFFLLNRKLLRKSCFNDRSQYSTRKINNERFVIFLFLFCSTRCMFPCSTRLRSFKINLKKSTRNSSESSCRIHFSLQKHLRCLVCATVIRISVSVINPRRC